MAEGLPEQAACAEVSVRVRRVKAARGQDGLRRGNARRATQATAPARRCRSPTSAPIATASTRWGKDFAVAANKVVGGMGIERKGLVEGAADRLPRRTSTASGCVRRTCTTGRCRHCATCSSPSSSGRSFLPRLRPLGRREGRLRDHGRGRRTYQVKRYDVEREGGGNQGHTYGTTLTPRRRTPSSGKDSPEEEDAVKVTRRHAVSRPVRRYRSTALGLLFPQTPRPAPRCRSRGARSGCHCRTVAVGEVSHRSGRALYGGVRP